MIGSATVFDLSYLSDPRPYSKWEAAEARKQILPQWNWTESSQCCNIYCRVGLSRICQERCIFFISNTDLAFYFIHCGTGTLYRYLKWETNHIVFFLQYLVLFLYHTESVYCISFIRYQVPFKWTTVSYFTFVHRTGSIDRGVTHFIYALFVYLFYHCKTLVFS